MFNKTGRKLIAAFTAVTLIIAQYAHFGSSPKTARAATVCTLDAAYHTQAEIKAYYNSHPFTNEDVSYTTEPSLTAPGKAGVVSNGSLNNILNRMNVYRYIAGVDEVSIGTDEQKEAQAAALIMAANNSITASQSKPTGFSDSIYNLATNGLASSNKGRYAGGYGYAYSDFVKKYMETDGSNHTGNQRLYMLDPYLKKTGFGCVNSASGDLFNSTFINPDTNIDKIIAYPARNQPLELFRADEYWTVTTPFKCYSNTLWITVTDKKTGEQWTMNSNSSEYREYGYIYGTYEVNGCTYIVFHPEIMEYKNGDQFHVKIENNTKNEGNHLLEYDVNFFTVTDVPVSGVEFSKVSGNTYEKGNEVINGTLQADQSYTQLTVKVLPENASDQFVTFSVSDPKIARVEKLSKNKARVVGIKKGTVTVTVTTKDGGHAASQEITVLPRAASLVSDLPDKITVGREQPAIKLDKPAILPEEADDELAWESADSSVAKISGTGHYDYVELKGIKNGTTTVTLWAKSNRAVKKEITVNVIDPVYVTKLKVNKSSVTLMPGESFTPVVTITPSNATYKEYKMTSSVSGVVTIKDGVIKQGSIPGKTTITVEALDGSNVTTSFEVIVIKKGRTITNPPSVESVTSTSVTLVDYDEIFTHYSTVEYSMDKEHWQTDTLFDNLKPNTTYQFYQRVAAESEYLIAGDISNPATVTTLGDGCDINGHSWTHTTIKAATNVSPGVKLSTCSVCKTSIRSYFDTKGALVLLGDANLDGVTDIKDLTRLARHIASIEELTNSKAKYVSNTNLDSVVDIKDLTTLARHVANIETF